MTVARVVGYLILALIWLGISVALFFGYVRRSDFVALGASAGAYFMSRDLFDRAARTAKQ